MVVLLEQIGALILLCCGLAFGWHRWIRPYRKELDAQALGMMMLAILAVAGGAFGSPFWWMDYPASFSWTLPPLAARLLAAAGASFAVTGWYALEQRREDLVRSYVAMLAIYLAPLVAAIVLLHLGRFDWRAPITYAFFVVAGGMALAALWHVARETKLGPSYQARAERAVLRIVRTWLYLIAAVTGLWGLALFVHPQGPLPQIWVWPQDALTSRLIASMLLTLCVAATLGLRSLAQARMSLWMFVVYGIGAAAACFWNLAAGKAVPPFYAAVFSMLGPISLALLFVPQAPQRQSA